MDTVSYTASPDVRQTSLARRVLAAGAAGQFVEFYDFAVYGFSVVIIAHLFFPQSDPVASISSAFAAYGVAFIARPLGGVIFGTLGDRIGRKAVLFITLLSIGAATALIGVLPTHSQIGIWAPVLLLVCRLVQGFSAGAEAVGAPSFVLEHAPVHRRAVWIGITIGMSAVPVIVAGVFILVLTHFITTDSYNSWGWRIPFLVAAPLSFIGLYIRNQTEESHTFESAAAESRTKHVTPLSESFRHNRQRMMQVFFVVALNGLAYYVLVGYLVTYMQTVTKISFQDALLSNAVGLLVVAIFLPLFGFVSDKVGRKPMLLTGAVLIALTSIPLFKLLDAGNGLAGAIGAQVVLAGCLTVYGAGAYTFFVEIFPTSVRFTGAAIAYNLAYAVFGGTAPFVGTYLVRTTGNATAPGYYLAALATVVFFVVLTVPETRGRDLNQH
jgi:MHS family proline/betaine transporter-like MFS transporter